MTFGSIAKATLHFLGRRKAAYVRVFTSDDGDYVLRDLAKFCRAGKTAFDKDERVTALLQGRQEVFLRIAQHLNLSADKLYEIYGGPKENIYD